jgi:hypothetical protein
MGKFIPTVAAWEKVLRDALAKQAKTGTEGLTRLEIVKALKCSQDTAAKLLRGIKDEGRLIVGKRPITIDCLDGVTRRGYQTVYSVKP